MQHDILYTRWIIVDGNNGTDAIPFDVVFSDANKKTLHPTFSDVKDYTQNTKAYDISVHDGYGARLSMPGYLDCTEWAVFDTKEDAEAYLDETYGD